MKGAVLHSTSDAHHSSRSLQPGRGKLHALEAKGIWLERFLNPQRQLEMGRLGHSLGWLGSVQNYQHWKVPAAGLKYLSPRGKRQL